MKHDDCKDCAMRRKTPLTSERIEELRRPGSGTSVMSLGGTPVLVAYCANCLTQIAWMVFEGVTYFSRIEWAVVDDGS